MGLSEKSQKRFCIINFVKVPKLCQSPKTLTKSINLIINHFCSMLCVDVLQTPIQIKFFKQIYFLLE